MRKIILYIASSLDGFIARPNGDINWLHDPEFILEGEDFGYADFLEQIDTTLMGHKTYQMVAGFDMPFPYKDKQNFVFTNASKIEKKEYVSFVNRNIIKFTEDLKMVSGKDIWLIGGGIINTLMLEAGLIDEIILTLIPVTLGEGIKTFENNKNFNKFILKKTRTYENGMVQLFLLPN